MPKTKNGFTLIELLVVIAIIGVLSAVVLASLNTARSKGNDAAVESDLNGIRTQAAIYYDSPTGGNQSYTGLCADTTVANQIAGADSANGASATVTCNVATDGTAYAVSSPLVAQTGEYYCVDSIGTATTTTTDLGTGTACP